jgi:hypothetical protein
VMIGCHRPVQLNKFVILNCNLLHTDIFLYGVSFFELFRQDRRDNYYMLCTHNSICCMCMLKDPSNILT